MKLSSLPVLLIFLCPALLLAQSRSRESKPPRVCVAIVDNASAVSAYVERLTERLVKNLQRGKVEAVAMESSTTKERTLRPTRQNIDEAEDKQCNYTLLTQIAEIRAHPAAPQTTKRDGAIVPSLDASDPLSGSSGPVYREDMEIAFALFRASKYDPVLDTDVLEPASANVSDTFLAGMDRIANRVSHDITKKKK
jgi:hypothetical protein